MTPREYAQAQGISPSLVQRWLTSGRLAGTKISGRWHIPPEAVPPAYQPIRYSLVYRLPDADLPAFWARAAAVTGQYGGHTALEILQARWQPDGQPRYSLAAIARQWGVSRAWVRQLSVWAWQQVQGGGQ